MEKPPFSTGFLKPTPVLVDEYFNGSAGDGDEGDTDVHGPWQTSFGLQPVESELNGGPGLSVDKVFGTEEQEERGKQDSGQKATTSCFDEALSQTAPSIRKPGLNGDGHSDDEHRSSSKRAKASKH